MLTVPVHTGDIFAAALTQITKCSPGDTITMSIDNFSINGFVR
jgi:hypothetical protein